MGNTIRRLGNKRPSSLVLRVSPDGAPAAAASSTVREAVHWSDVAASRKSTHPDAAPVKKVLNVTELCEQVLLHLSPSALIHARKVCRTFRNAIDSTPSLQRALFLQVDPALNARSWAYRQQIYPIDNEEEVYGDDMYGDEYELPEEGPKDIAVTSPLLTSEAAAKYADEAEQTGVRFTGVRLTTIRPLVVNPLLSRSMKYKRETLERRAFNFIAEGPNKNTISLSDFKEQLLFCGRYAICRQMFLSQPPVTKIKLSFEGWISYPAYEDRRGLPKGTVDHVGSVDLEDKDGIRLHQVLTAAYRGVNCERGTGRLYCITFLDGLAVGEEESRMV